MLRVLLLSLSLFSSYSFASELSNCGFSFKNTAVPQRVVSLNQHTTELLLALGLEKHLVGTAFLDDEIAPAYRAAYESIPVLAEKYPSREVILATAPDLIVGGFRTAFSKKAAGNRSSLAARNIDSFLSSDQCLKEGQKADLALLQKDILMLGQLFNIEQRAQQLIETLKQGAGEIAAQAPKPQGKKPTALLLDSADKAAYSAACCGMGQQLMDLLGLENIAAKTQGKWAQLSWEAVVKQDPQWILLVDASWSSAESKRQLLLDHPVLSQLSAVRQQRFVTIPFSATVNSVQFVEYARQAQRQLLDKFAGEVDG